MPDLPQHVPQKLEEGAGKRRGMCKALGSLCGNFQGSQARRQGQWEAQGRVKPADPHHYMGTCFLPSVAITVCPEARDEDLRKLTSGIAPSDLVRKLLTFISVVEMVQASILTCRAQRAQAASSFFRSKSEFHSS